MQVHPDRAAAFIPTDLTALQAPDPTGASVDESKDVFDQIRQSPHIKWEKAQGVLVGLTQALNSLREGDGPIAPSLYLAALLSQLSRYQEHTSETLSAMLYL